MTFGELDCIKFPDCMSASFFLYSAFSWSCFVFLLLTITHLYFLHCSNNNCEYYCVYILVLLSLVTNVSVYTILSSLLYFPKQFELERKVVLNWVLLCHTGPIHWLWVLLQIGLYSQASAEEQAQYPQHRIDGSVSHLRPQSSGGKGYLNSITM